MQTFYSNADFRKMKTFLFMYMNSCDVIICYLKLLKARSWPVHLYPIFNAHKNTNLWAHNKVISLVLLEQSRYTYIIMQDKQIQVNVLVLNLQNFYRYYLIEQSLFKKFVFLIYT